MQAANLQKVSTALTFTSLIILFFVLGVASAQGHPGFHRHVHGKTVVVERRQVVTPAPARNLAVRTLGEVVSILPAGYRRISYQGRTWFVADGVYFARHARGFVVVRPVAGIRVVTLPRGYTTLRSAGAFRYRYRGVTYRRIENYYVVV